MLAVVEHGDRDLDPVNGEVLLVMLQAIEQRLEPVVIEAVEQAEKVKPSFKFSKALSTSAAGRTPGGNALFR
ncbi:MAG TPA: hypothetical protein VK672_07050 [Solirubrobacteraceae bacterium]|nr:hypothetical protein [Solirubrobacteraceae bacterium]